MQTQSTMPLDFAHTMLRGALSAAQNDDGFDDPSVGREVDDDSSAAQVYRGIEYGILALASLVAVGIGVKCYLQRRNEYSTVSMQNDSSDATKVVSSPSPDL